ncbi:hypothetical protein BD408DRAFT_412663 [Parasitella parasitica]|nr:hypothetical protein BD408DRAFT_412663 [Parasitella parasitica]
MSDQRMEDLANEYRTLRDDKDSGSDRLYEVMKALGEQLGVPNTLGKNILSTLGKPDEVKQSISHDQVSVQTMPGPAIPSSATTESSDNQQPYYLVYDLSPNKHLYFKIDSAKETVITSGWYE